MLDDFALIHKNDPVSHFTRKTHLVGHAQHRHAGMGQLDHHFQHFLDHFRVQRRGRLVKQHDFRLHAQGTCNGHALLLSARELSGIFVGLLWNTYTLQILHGQLLSLGLGLATNPHRPQSQVFHHGQVRKQIEVLKHHAHVTPNGLDLTHIVGKLLTSHNDLPFLMLFQAIDAADQGGLARTRRPTNNDALAGGHIQIDIAQHMELPVPFIDVL